MVAGILEVLDVNYIVASLLGGLVISIFGLVKWVLMRLDKERDERHKELSRDRHALRGDLQKLQNELGIAKLEHRNLEDKLKFTEKLLEDTRKQMDLKDKEIVKLRDQVDTYTKILIERGIQTPAAP